MLTKVKYIINKAAVVGIDTRMRGFELETGIAYLLALENANNLTVSPMENIEYDRWVLLTF
ncbi:hypothetical protein CK203_041513 [Vitis vinifera]|uniref:Uncharacterized protein n=1 Tax=Vitis vinifera TaxID=29760 RepID=A0A438HNJ2_VITVI|nr:hypothetical protein CK203_041513 [Vitis vinifera]